MLSTSFLDKSRLFKADGSPGGGFTNPRFEQSADFSWQEHTIGGHRTFDVPASEAKEASKAIMGHMMIDQLIGDLMKHILDFLLGIMTNFVQRNTVFANFGHLIFALFRL